MPKLFAILGLLILSCSRLQASVTTLAAGSDLQAAINAAAPGDTLTLPAGATFTGPLRLPVHADGGYVTITTAGFAVAAGKRVSPADAPGMARIVAPGANQGAVVAMAAAHHWRLVGLEIMPATAATVCSELVQLGDGHPTTQNSLDQVPHDLIVDRCYVHGWPTSTTIRGICLQCGYAEVRNCCIADIHDTGRDTQAVAGWNGPGPFLIDNCDLQASGENVLFGGSDPGIPNLTPSDITISNNTIRKPLSWRVGDPSYAGIHWECKNLFEIKNAQRVTIDHNLFENSWADAQAGFAINLKSSNQTGVATWSVCRDVTVSGNVIRHCGSGIGIGRDPLPVVLPSHIAIRGNRLYDVNSSKWGGDGVFLQIGWASYVTVDGNICSQTGLIVSPFGPFPMTGFVFAGNTVSHGAYGVKAAGMTPGTASLNAVWGDSWTFERNTIVAHPAQYPPSIYPAGNEWPDGWGDLAAEALKVGG